MKIAVLVSNARQVDGEFFLVNVVKAHKNAEQLYRYLRENELPRTMNSGDIPCVIEYGVIEDVEVEGLEEK